ETPTRTLSGSSTQIANPTAMTVDGANNILYVADKTNQNILVFTSASTLDGDQAPTRTFAGVQKAGILFYDSTHDSLYASDVGNNTANKILVWDKASTLSDGASASRTIPLDYAPATFTVDTQRDLLYVGDTSAQAINVYTSASTLGTSPVANATF